MAEKKPKQLSFFDQKPIGSPQVLKSVYRKWDIGWQIAADTKGIDPTVARRRASMVAFEKHLHEVQVAARNQRNFRLYLQEPPPKNIKK